MKIIDIYIIAIIRTIVDIVKIITMAVIIIIVIIPQIVYQLWLSRCKAKLQIRLGIVRECTCPTNQLRMDFRRCKC